MSVHAARHERECRALAINQDTHPSCERNCTAKWRRVIMTRCRRLWSWYSSTRHLYLPGVLLSYQTVADAVRCVFGARRRYAVQKRYEYYDLSAFFPSSANPRLACSCLHVGWPRVPTAARPPGTPAALCAIQLPLAVTRGGGHPTVHTQRPALVHAGFHAVVWHAAWPNHTRKGALP